MKIEIPQYTAIRYMVYDVLGAVRGFPTRAEAEKFVDGNDEYSIEVIPKKIKTIEVEEAPF